MLGDTSNKTNDFTVSGKLSLPLDIKDVCAGAFTDNLTLETRYVESLSISILVKRSATAPTMIMDESCKQSDEQWIELND